MSRLPTTVNNTSHYNCFCCYLVLLSCSLNAVYSFDSCKQPSADIMVCLCFFVDPCSPPVHRRHPSLGRSDEEDDVDRESSKQSDRELQWSLIDRERVVTQSPANSREGNSLHPLTILPLLGRQEQKRGAWTFHLDRYGAPPKLCCFSSRWQKTSSHSYITSKLRTIRGTFIHCFIYKSFFSDKFKHSSALFLFTLSFAKRI